MGLDWLCVGLLDWLVLHCVGLYWIALRLVALACIVLLDWIGFAFDYCI